jgi:hypothetical protein
VLSRVIRSIPTFSSIVIRDIMGSKAGLLTSISRLKDMESDSLADCVDEDCATAGPVTAKSETSQYLLTKLEIRARRRFIRRSP